MGKLKQCTVHRGLHLIDRPLIREQYGMMHGLLENWTNCFRLRLTSILSTESCVLQDCGKTETNVSDFSYAWEWLFAHYPPRSAFYRIIEKLKQLFHMQIQELWKPKQMFQNFKNVQDPLQETDKWSVIKVKQMFQFRKWETETIV